MQENRLSPIARNRLEVNEVQKMREELPLGFGVRVGCSEAGGRGEELDRCRNRKGGGS